MPAAVGVPEMTPVEELMESPGGSPEAEKFVPACVAVTVKMNGDPELPVASATEFTAGETPGVISPTTWMSPDELKLDVGTTPEARTKKGVAVGATRPVICHVDWFTFVPWPTTVQVTSSVDSSKSTPPRLGAPPPCVQVRVDKSVLAAIVSVTGSVLANRTIS